MTQIKRYFSILLAAINFIVAFAEGEQEVYTYRLSQSTSGFVLWTTLTSVKVFQDMEIPKAEDSRIKMYAARNEFEPFQIIVKPQNTGSVVVEMMDFGYGIEVELYEVKYVEIAQPSDALGQTGPYPDPLMPVENGSTIVVEAGKNTPIWVSVYVPETVPAGTYTANVRVGDITVPVELKVFNFALPQELHVKSQMNISYQDVLTKYGVTGYASEYWAYVDHIKQWFVDHRLTPKSVLWPGGLSVAGGAPFIDYDCGGTLSDPYGVWGFEEPALRYLGGAGTMSGNLDGDFNHGFGFPSFMAMTFKNNDASQDQRPVNFCGETLSGGDWYTADNPNSSYNQKWFEYITGIQNYLNNKGYLDKAYFYLANEPNNQAAYDAVAWYSQELKKAAPSLRLMVSEQPRPEIFDNATYTGSKIDIWLPVLNNYDPLVSHEREENHNEETWIYFLHGTRPPYFNPVTLDHQGVESKLTGWFLWKYRIKGIAYYAMNNWSRNPWADPLNNNHNGDLFMFYPPSMSNDNISFGANGHRFVPSIRLELLRESLEDYEYLYLLSGGAQPEVGISNEADVQVDKIIGGLISYNRDDEFMHDLRRLIGLKIGGEISAVPDVYPTSEHPRSKGEPGDYYINFQDPTGLPVASYTDGDESYFVFEGKDYLRVGVNAYDETKGYGWYAPNDVNWMMHYNEWFDNGNELQKSVVYSDWGRRAVFEFDLPNGDYNVTASIGHSGGPYARQFVTIEGVECFTAASTYNSVLVNTREVVVKDNKLTMEIGAPENDEYTMLNYLDVEAQKTTFVDWGEEEHVVDAWLSPNPFRSDVSIYVCLDRPQVVRIDILNAQGQVVAQVFDGRLTETNNRVFWSGKCGNGAELIKGVYFCRVIVGGDKSCVIKCLRE